MALLNAPTQSGQFFKAGDHEAASLLIFEPDEEKTIIVQGEEKTFLQARVTLFNTPDSVKTKTPSEVLVDALIGGAALPKQAGAGKKPDGTYDAVAGVLGKGKTSKANAPWVLEKVSDEFYQAAGEYLEERDAETEAETPW